MLLEKLEQLPRGDELGAILSQKSITIPQLRPAPMLKRSADMKAWIAKNPGEKYYNGTVGEPPVDGEILRDIEHLLLNPVHVKKSAEHHEQSPLIHELTDWVKGFVGKMTLYCPKPGDPTLRKQFLSEFSRGFFAESEHIILTGGMNVVENNVTALLNLSREDKSHETKRIDFDPSGNFEAVMQQVDEAQESQQYISLWLKNSASKLSEDQKAKIMEKVQRGRMIIVDLLSDNFDRDRSVGALKGLGEHVVSVTATPLSEITGVYGVFCNEKMAKFMMERNTNIKGTPSAEMFLAQKLIEFADLSKRGELFDLTDEDIEGIVTPEHKYLKNLIRLLQYAAFYVYEDDVTDDQRLWGKEVFQEHVASQLKTLEDQTKKILVKKKLIRPDETVVWDNGGARGLLDEQIQFFEEKFGTRDIIIFTPCWSYIDLITEKRNLVWTPAFTKKGFQIDRVIRMFERFEGKNATVVIPIGPHNPTGFIIKANEMEKIVKAAKKSGVHIIFDPTYEAYMDPRTASRSARPSQVARRSKKFITTTTYSASKNLLLPPARLAAGISRNPDIIRYHQNSPSRTNHEVNALATLTLAAMTQDSKRLNAVTKKVRDLTGRRRETFRRIANRRGVKHGNHRSGYYEWAESSAIANKGSSALKTLVDQGVGVLGFSDDLNADPSEWHNTARIVLFHDPKVPENTYEDNVIYLFDQTEQVASS